MSWYQTLHVLLNKTTHCICTALLCSYLLHGSGCCVEYTMMASSAAHCILLASHWQAPKTAFEKQHKSRKAWCRSWCSSIEQQMLCMMQLGAADGLCSCAAYMVTTVVAIHLDAKLHQLNFVSVFDFIFTCLCIFTIYTIYTFAYVKSTYVAYSHLCVHILND